MKKVNLLLACSFILASSFFVSCKKQIDKPSAQEKALQAQNITSTSCRAVTYGTYQTGINVWTTIMQKWYSNNRIQFFKAHFSGRPEGFSQLLYSEPLLNIDWGEVTYEGDQVQVRDVGKNKLVFRATLDQWGKPVASYLYNYMGSANEWVFIDTSYYYYTGDRLNYIMQLLEKRYNDESTFRGWERYTFTYSGSGELGYHHAKNGNVTTGFSYIYAPATGIVADYILTTSYRMLEFLDLIKVPFDHPLYEVTMTNYNPRTGVPNKFYVKNFYNYSITNGLVQSYQTPYTNLYYYIGWECSGSSANANNKQNSIITNLDQFKELYPDSGK